MASAAFPTGLHKDVMDNTAQSRSGKNRLPYWYVIVVLCFLGWVFLYADRTILSPVLGAIGDEWGLDEAQLGLISSVFFLAYTAVQIPTGLVADRFGKKGLLVSGFILFGLATGLSGLAPHYASFLLAGALAGFGQGTYYATQFALSSSAIPQSRRGFGTAVINSGMAVGISLGLILASFTTFRLGWGWRAPFVVMALPTIIVGLLFAIYIRERSPGHGDPRTIHRNGHERRDGAGASPNAPTEGGAVPIRAALSARLIGLYFVNFTSLYGFFFILTWLPYYLQFERDFPVASTGLISSLVPWASIPGALLISYLSDRSGKRLQLVRLLLPAAAVSIFGIAYVQSAALLFAFLIFYGLVGKLAVDPLLVALVSELAPAERLATAMGFLNFGGMAASVLAPYITGYLTATFGNMELAFYLSAAVLLIGFAVSLLLGAGPSTRQVRRTRSA